MSRAPIPALRTGQSTVGATHLIKVAVEAALGKRPKLDVYGTDYNTPDGTCVRDYIHVIDLANAHMAALTHLRGGGDSATFNCGYGHGYSVLEVVDAVKRVSGRDFKVELAPRRPGDPAMIVADSARIRAQLGWAPRFDNLDTIVEHALAWERRLRKHLRSDAPRRSADVHVEIPSDVFPAGALFRLEIRAGGGQGIRAHDRRRPQPAPWSHVGCATDPECSSRDCSQLSPILQAHWG